MIDHSIYPPTPNITIVASYINKEIKCSTVECTLHELTTYVLSFDFLETFGPSFGPLLPLEHHREQRGSGMEGEEDVLESKRIDDVHAEAHVATLRRHYDTLVELVHNNNNETCRAGGS